MLRPKKQSLKPKLKHRPFLKWAGGKFRLTDDLNRVFPKRKQCLIEPFVGAGAVFLNSDFFPIHILYNNISTYVRIYY